MKFVFIKDNMTCNVQSACRDVKTFITNMRFVIRDKFGGEGTGRGRSPPLPPQNSEEKKMVPPMKEEQGLPPSPCSGSVHVIAISQKNTRERSEGHFVGVIRPKIRPTLTFKDFKKLEIWRFIK